MIIAYALSGFLIGLMSWTLTGSFFVGLMACNGTVLFMAWCVYATEPADDYEPVEHFAEEHLR